MLSTGTEGTGGAIIQQFLILVPFRAGGVTSSSDYSNKVLAHFPPLQFVDL